MKITAKSLIQKLFKVHLLIWILIFAILGVIFGLTCKDFSIQFLGLLSSTIFLPMVKAIVVPLVFSTLVVGIASHNDIAAVGRMAVKSLVYFMLLSIPALFLGLVFATIISPGTGVKLGEDETFDRNTSFSLRHELEMIIPHSFFEAAAKNETLQIVFCACMFASGIILCPNKNAKKHMLDFCESLSLIMFKVTELIMNFVPFAICGAFAETIAEHGLGVMINLGKLVACVYVGLLTFVGFLCLLALVLRIPLIKFMKAIWEPLTISFATASSEAVLSMAMENMVEFGVPKSIVAFVIPTGYSFNLAGTTLYLGAAAIFAMQAGGIEKTLGEQITMLGLLLIMSKGVAAVPRASIVILASACKSFGLPLSAVTIILGVDQVMDMARTAINLFGNCLACVVIAKWEGEFGRPHLEDEVVDIEASSVSKEKINIA